jgi:NitT/TauT family transport system substrate-binding protein
MSGQGHSHSIAASPKGAGRTALVAVAAIAASLLTMTIARSDPASTTQLAFGYAPSAPLPAFYVGQSINAFENQGLKLKVENMADTTFILDMLQSKQIDIGGGATATVVQRRALGVPVKVISAFGYSFTDKSGRSWEGVHLIAPKSRNITKMGDLKGKRVAVVSFGSTWDIALRQRLRDAQVDPKDVTILAMPFTQMAAALSSDQIDAAAITVAEYARVNRATPVNILMSASQLTGVKIDVTQFVVARDDWLEKNEETAVRFLKALLQAHQWMVADIRTDNGAKVKQVIKEKLGYDDFLTDTTFELRVGLESRMSELVNPYDVPRSTIDSYNKILIDGGLLRGKPPAKYEDLVDNRYLRRAYKELGMTWDDKLN